MIGHILPLGKLVEENKKDINKNGQTEAEKPASAGTARILARAGEAFDAVEAGRALHEGGLKDPSKLEPTDQSFVFAEPGQQHANFVADDETLHETAPLHEAAPLRPDAPRPGDGLGQAPPAVDLTEAPDPGISWRARHLPPGAEALPMGVLREGGAPACPKSIYDTGPGLFGPGDPWLYEGEDASSEPTELVLGVKFREYGSVYFFRGGNEQIKAGGQVLVETEQGLSLADVISAQRMRLPLPKIRTADGEELEIKAILGLPGPEDIAAAADNKILASGARLFCKECIRERNLDMKLVDVEVLHDRSKIIFYFTAPTRIDFRELVKDLVRNYRTRIELRQIGVRHETQMLGALGNCGMACCCRRYLRRFAPVTIKMAKEQNLFLNPAKLSGICGRLLCCLANEQENYEEFHRNCPKIGKKYQTSRGIMKVLRANLFRQSIVAVVEDGEEEEFLLDSWHALNPQRLEVREQRETRGDDQITGDDENNVAASAFAYADMDGQNLNEADLAALVDDEAQKAPADARREGPDLRQGREGQENHENRNGQGRRRDRGPRGKRGGQNRRPEQSYGPQNSAGEQNNSTPQKAGGEEERDNSIFGLPGSKFNKK